MLSEPVRLRLLALAAAEELAIGELAELLGESQPNVSRHAAPLRQLGLLAVRKEGTRTLVRLAEAAAADPVVVDALASGTSLCEEEGSLSRIADVLRARDEVTREFFGRPRGERPDHDGDARSGPGFAGELGAYVALFAPLLSSRKLAVDAGTGDGGLLDVLAPAFERVVAIDREEAQLAMAKERVRRRGFGNVELVCGELEGADVAKAVGVGADVVFASRLLHHAPRPAAVVSTLARLVAPGGALVVLDYARHDDETMRAQADLWLGFDGGELRRFARDAGLSEPQVLPIAAVHRGHGPDAHLPWIMLAARKPREPGSAPVRPKRRPSPR